MRAAVAATALGAVLIPALACTPNPATASSEPAPMTVSQEIAMGSQSAADIARTVGLYPDPAVQSYVAKLGRTLAERSARPQLPWQFEVIDDAAVDAFALPGGYVFVTRGLLTHLTDQAELAAVLAHAAAHVAARHSIQQISRKGVAQLGLGVGMAISPVIRRYGQQGSAGLGLLFLEFSPAQETEADQLGFAYALADGDDVRQTVALFQMLERQGERSGVGRLPEWQSTHPDPESGARTTEGLLAAAHTGPGPLTVGREAYFHLIDGMVYGDDPRQGYFAGTLFVHPSLKFRFQFPDGWMTQDAAGAVFAASRDQDALIELRIVPGSAQGASASFFSAQGVHVGNTSQGSVNGFAATQGAFTAEGADSTAVRGVATFIEDGANTYRILAYATTAKFASYAPAFDSASSSFGRLTDPRALAAKPMRVKIEAVPAAMTLEEFNARSPSSIPLDELALINGLEKGSALVAGQLVKCVVQ